MCVVSMFVCVYACVYVCMHGEYIKLMLTFSCAVGLKKRGFGQGKWNGFGGKVEAGETIEAAAARELKEESLVELGDGHALEKRGILNFFFAGEPKVMQVCVETHVQYAYILHNTHRNIHRLWHAIKM
jgi:8-oxo-dGTP pyrophosphatase MutT (NUDIX family)